VRSAHNVAIDASLAVEREASAKGVRVHVVPADGEAMIDRAGSALQVLVNLLLNGVAFSPHGGSLELRWEIRDFEAHFWVTDEGPGVPAGMRDQLFGGRQSMRPGGAGIGLSHSHSMAVASGGALRLNQTVRGASFELVWPTCEAPSQLVQRLPVPAAIEGLRVVVLEDDPAVLSMIEFGLESKGATVLAASSVEQLRLAMSTADRVDVALLDLSPIQDDPKHLLEELRRVRAGLPVLLISGSAATPDVELPFSGWVQKPFELNELFEAIRAVVANSSR
jgi:CheY-like chemotaxis protein